MKLSNHTYKVLAVALSLGFGTFGWSCSDKADEPEYEIGGEEASSPRYFIALDITVPTQATTRTETNTDGSSSSGTLNGTQNEYTISSADIFFCVDNDVKLKLTTIGDPTAVTPTTTGMDKTYTIKADVTEDLTNLAELRGKTCQIYVVCNPGQISGYTLDSSTNSSVAAAKFEVKDDITKNPIGDFLGSQGEQGQLMPMTNSHVFNYDIPDGNTIEDALVAIKALFTVTGTGTELTQELGSIDVERSVARLDLKDGSSSNNWTYKIGTSNVNITLQSVQPFNVSKESYVFRHRAVGNLTKATGAVGLFGNENNDTQNTQTDYDWVTDPSWSTYVAGTDYTKTLNFWNPLVISSKPYTISGTKGLITIDELTSDVTGKVRTKQGIRDDLYYPWQYVTENTLPNIGLMDDENIISNATGVTFNFRIKDKKGNYLTTATPEKDYPDEIKKCTDTEAPVNSITITMDGGVWMNVAPTSEVKNGEDVVLPAGYYLTYYGFIMHNNKDVTSSSTTTIDGEEVTETVTKPGPMKYGVVRNNIYQLCVTRIDNLPDPQEPKNLFLSLDIKVLAWAKRDIHVTF